MDPQQRLLLQCAWRALEDSGIDPPALAGSATGVYVGCMSDDWARLQAADPARVTPRTGTGSGRAMLANRISYQLDLRGPCLTVDSACSSSLVAVHLARTALLAGECDTALAGGANLVLGTTLDLIYQQSGLAAPDGRCKPFSSAADGIGRAEGIGVVVLRRLADALRDGQPVYAVLRGSAVNQDGRSNGMMAPSRAAQREVVRAACRSAGAAPAEVAFVEAHGTGTVLGDAIEAAALADVYGSGRERPLPIGSVKASIGHAEGAAGIAGLIKAVLSLHHGVVPAGRVAGPTRPDLAGHGLALVREPLALPREGCLAGVSSFGMGGSNAHLVLASAPPAGRTAPRTPTVFDTARRFWPEAAAAAAPDTAGAQAGSLDELTGAVVESVALVLGGAAADCGPHARFYDDLGFDSVNLMELKYRLEDRYPALAEVSLAELLPGLETVGSLVDLLRSRLISAAV
ncbi:beta-ketoacyl synthase N-terminal-like domain-containing protein [Kitasatospora sp. NPDC059571]|uniref:beta-ketoacyl synthase N-terminal-like domain-containing protein n=1 Tax=Kitasatospora sp. NPDC059571 TaxID=3346871 RepID=UPI0036B3FE9B